VVVPDPSIFSVSGLDARSNEAIERLLGCLRGRELSAEHGAAADKLTAQAVGSILESTQALKTLLPKHYSRWAGEYYAETQFERVREAAPQLDQYLLSLQRTVGARAEGEQPSGELQAIAADLGRLTLGFINESRDIGRTIRAVSVRDYPRGSPLDTIVIMPGEQVRHLKDSSGFLVFQNREVVRVNLRAEGEFPRAVGELPVGVTDDGRHVIQQTGMQGCVGAATNMILMDFGRKPDMARQYSSHFDNDGEILRTLNNAGLHGEVITLPRMRRAPAGEAATEDDHAALLAQVETLERVTRAGQGGVLLSLSSEVGGHEVVLDAFSFAENRATIRDPLHGWSIDVPPAAVLRRLGGALVVVTDPRRAQSAPGLGS